MDGGEYPELDRRELYLRAATDEANPDMDRVMCALAYLDGATVANLAELLEWDNSRVRTALAAAAEQGFAAH